jgi:uncharacterized protein (TIGR03435 family)
MTCRLDGRRCLFVMSCLLLLVGCLAISVRAQGPEQDWEKAAGGKQQFEVASVRENKLDGQSSGNFALDGNGNVYWEMDQNDEPVREGSLFRATHQPLLRYIIFAYKLSGTQELPLRLQFWAGLSMKEPEWVKHTLFDIEARAPGAATKDQMRLMMQSLLADRFKLAVHWETRQVPVFAMTLEKPGTLGPQLHVHPASDTCATTVFPHAASADGEKDGTQKSAASADSIQMLPIPCGMIARLPASVPGRHRIGGRNVTLAMVAESLPAQTGLATFPRPVIDRTGLGGTFDFTLEWTQAVAGDMAVGPNARGEVPGPPMAQALKQQLGIKLESTKGPVELFVIDHVEMPTANGEN